jgi:anti-sigma-K factor RskA
LPGAGGCDEAPVSQGARHRPELLADLGKLRPEATALNELHDLAAAYALNALDPEDRWTYERHLDTCERCREEVARLRDGAAELAYAAEGPEPSQELRERILDAARAERPAPVVPLRRRWLFPATAVAAAAAACTAIGLALWANSLRNEIDRQRTVAFQGVPGQLVISGDEASIVTCVDRAPAGKTYEAWVIENEVPRPAGLFRGGCGTVELTREVEPGVTVAVTLEPGPGSDVPTGDVLMSANV